MAGSSSVDMAVDKTITGDVTSQEINQLRSVTTQMVCKDVENSPTFAGSDAEVEDADDHTGVPDKIAVIPVHSDCWEPDSIQEEQHVCNDLA